jgi:ABC-type transport system involved in multi-copper enzyme maturation permease subunit
MIARVITLYGIEIVKASKQRFAYAGPLLLLAGIAGAALIKKDDLAENAYRFIAYSTDATLNLAGILIVLAFCSALVASEISSGTARLIFVRPVKRHEFVFAKFLIGVTYAFTLTLLVAVASWMVAALDGKLEGITYGGELLFSAQEMQIEYLKGLALSLVPQMALVSYALFISVISKNTGAAISIAAVAGVLIELVKYGLGIERLLFSTWLDMPWRVFSAHCDGLRPAWRPDVYWCVGTSVAATILFLGAASFAMRHRNLHA